jgi:hypothetical protein
MVLPRLYEVMCRAWKNQGGGDRARSWLYHHYAGYNDVLDFEPDLASQMVNDIREFSSAAFERSWRTLGEWNAHVTWSWHPATTLSSGEALELVEICGVPRLAAVAAQVFTDPYAYYKGWPDLLIVTADGSLRLTEVKVDDRLLLSQIITMADMRKAAALDITVLQLQRLT